MRQFRRLMRASLLAGTIAGTLLYLYRYIVIVPRIVAAEAFEARAEAAGGHGEEHQDSEWKPSSGLERGFFTAASTILTGIAFAALLISAVTLGGFSLDVRHGLLWGLAGFTCFTLAPALGLPPEPPGVPGGDVPARQLWWVLAVSLSVIGLILIVKSGRWMFRVVGGILLVLPHAIGVPQALGPQVVPAGLVRDFALASIVGNGLFWVALGIIAGVVFPTEPMAHQKEFRQ